MHHKKISVGRPQGKDFLGAKDCGWECKGLWLRIESRFFLPIELWMDATQQ